MTFEWDETKRLKNLKAHDLDFDDATEMFDGRPILTVPSFRNNEVRLVSVAKIGGKLHAVVWTWRSENRRIISFRRADNGQERAYRELHGSGDQRTS
jgi:hypothetical protein